MPATIPVLVVNDEAIEVTSSSGLLSETMVDSQGSVQVTGPEIQLLLDQGEQMLFQLKRIAMILSRMAGTDVTEEDIPT